MNVDELDYEQIVALHHEGLYRFAFSLAGNSDDAAELTQEAYVRLLNKSWQLRDSSKVKSWLFTTLYRIFLGWKHRKNRFPHIELIEAEDQLPPLTSDVADGMDSEKVMETALDLEEHYRVPLVLHYLQCLSYREIAEVLNLPIGTVMSRLSRGKDILRQRLMLKKLEKVRLTGIEGAEKPFLTLRQYEPR
jgi:RNA polymerase sigma-70 factor, ECF subfamily